jgi:hypothetical protein
VAGSPSQPSAARSSVIQVQNLTKTYRTYKKKPGFKGAIAGLLLI